MLLTAAGQELLAQIAASELSELRLGAELRRRYPADLVAAAMLQHELRVAARIKFTRADDMYFTRAGLEQASAEPVARLRSIRLAGVRQLADLCCGIGGDLVTLGRDLPVRAVDLDPVHLRFAAANAAVYGVDARFANADVRDVDLSDVDGVFVDPARRTGRSGTTARRMAAGESEPPLSWCFELADRVPAVCVKASPALDHALVPAGWEVEFVALGHDLKEAVLWSPALATSFARASVLVDGQAYALAGHGGHPAAAVQAPGEYLLDPSPAVTRAGLVGTLAAEVGAWQIDPRIAFLSANQPFTTPFGRSLRVLDSGPWHEKRLATRLRELDIGALDIRRRGLAGDVEQIRRRFKLAGTRRATVLMTRVKDRPWGFICVDAGQVDA